MTRYRTIVADPPWRYEPFPSLSTSVKSVKRPGYSLPAELDFRRAKPLPYALMDVTEIADLPVSAMADTDAHLYLSVPIGVLHHVSVAEYRNPPRINDGECVAQVAAGRPGLGGAFASNTEFVLFARRGSLAHIRRVDTRWWNWPRMGNAHSRKPEAFLDLVESVSPGPYLELFARRQRLGWDTWGDEALQHVELSA